jgi:GAF domain-containing protein
VSDGHPRPADARRERALRAVDALVDVAVRAAAAGRIAPPAGEAALQALAGAGAAVFRVTAISIALHDRSTDRLVFRAAAGPQGGGVVGLSIGAHDGIAGYVFSTGQALAVAEAAADPRFGRETAERTGYIPTSLLAVPLIDDAGIIGVMELLDRRDGAPFDLADIELATRMAAAATAVVRATRLDSDATALLGAVLAAVGRSDGGAGQADQDGGADQADQADQAVEADEARAPAEIDIEALLGEIGERLSDDDPLWRLADRIGRLRAADPDDVELAVAWLDALLARTRRRAEAGRRREP